MTADPRDELWEAAFETYYDAYYNELLAEKLVDKWQRVDETTRVLVAMTASTSAVSGWALWTQPHFRTVWVTVAGISAMLTIVHATLGVPRRLQDYGEIKRRFAALRTTLETFRYRMRFDPNFPLPDFTGEFVDYRSRYGEIVQLLKSDLLQTMWTERKVQAKLNSVLAEDIAH